MTIDLGELVVKNVRETEVPVETSWSRFLEFALPRFCFQRMCGRRGFKRVTWFELKPVRSIIGSVIFLVLESVIILLVLPFALISRIAHLFPKQRKQ